MSVSLTAVVDPWSTRMVAGWLNLTATPIGGASSTSVLATGPPLDTVTLLRDPPEPIADSASVWTGQYVYVFGGERAGGNVLRYEPSLNTWTTMNASFPSTLTLPSAVWAGTTAYIFGGYANGPQGTIYQYDPATDTLSQVGTMNPRSATAAVWDGQYAYILGGRTTNTAVSTVLRFDPLTATILNHGRWTGMGVVPPPCPCPCAVPVPLPVPVVRVPWPVPRARARCPCAVSRPPCPCPLSVRRIAAFTGWRACRFL